ncbi:hypothetical protein B0T24DRAFT_672748 [Lasiosphaeria ovina]|uniref:Uncharacterized protein n=1 Tax=Lasiosphaeria ovina TaxID=92902 RepID=A0AAE0NJR0_9PEZI|nr:hypothetical protein B0T24DRAFT_672748 [Lasiosphaeria ovina]
MFHVVQIAFGDLDNNGDTHNARLFHAAFNTEKTDPTLRPASDDLLFDLGISWREAPIEEETRAYLSSKTGGTFGGNGNPVSAVNAINCMKVEGKSREDLKHLDAFVAIDQYDPPVHDEAIRAQLNPERCAMELNDGFRHRYGARSPATEAVTITTTTTVQTTSVPSPQGHISNHHRGSCDHHRSPGRLNNHRQGRLSSRHECNHDHYSPGSSRDYLRGYFNYQCGKLRSRHKHHGGHSKHHRSGCRLRSHHKDSRHDGHHHSWDNLGNRLRGCSGDPQGRLSNSRSSAATTTAKATLINLGADIIGFGVSEGLAFDISCYNPDPQMGSGMLPGFFNEALYSWSQTLFILWGALSDIKRACHSDAEVFRGGYSVSREWRLQMPPNVAPHEIFTNTRLRSKIIYLENITGNQRSRTGKQQSGSGSGSDSGAGGGGNCNVPSIPSIPRTPGIPRIPNSNTQDGGGGGGSGNLSNPSSNNDGRVRGSANSDNSSQNNKNNAPSNIIKNHASTTEASDSIRHGTKT